MPNFVILFKKKRNQREYFKLQIKRCRIKIYSNEICVHVVTDDGTGQF